jgi:hypothetical protein
MLISFHQDVPELIEIWLNSIKIFILETYRTGDTDEKDILRVQVNKHSFCPKEISPILWRT